MAGSESVNIGSDTIDVVVPFGTNLNSLSGGFTLSEGAVSSPTSPISGNFSSPVTITVTAEDSTEKVWTVNVTVSNPLSNVTIDPFIFEAENDDIFVEATYNNVSSLPDEWIVDAFIQFSEEISSGTQARIIDPDIGGDFEVIAPSTLAPNTKIWLSDIIKAQAPGAPTRTKLNAHTVQTFEIEVRDLEATGDLTVTIIAANLAGLEGTTQGTDALTANDYIVLKTETIEGVEFLD